MSDRHSTNEIAPAGQANDRFLGEVESGQPAGGPYDLGKRAAEGENEEHAPDPLGEGIDAHESGIGRDACPYAETSEDGQRWLEGWDRQNRGAGEI